MRRHASSQGGVSIKLCIVCAFCAAVACQTWHSRTLAHDANRQPRILLMYGNQRVEHLVDPASAAWYASPSHKAGRAAVDALGKSDDLFRSEPSPEIGEARYSVRPLPHYNAQADQLQLIFGNRKQVNFFPAGRANPNPAGVSRPSANDPYEWMNEQPWSVQDGSPNADPFGGSTSPARTPVQIRIRPLPPCPRALPKANDETQMGTAAAVGQPDFSSGIGGATLSRMGRSGSY